ncbi:MAG: ABC transporter permease [Lachnospiraceae bacterium]|jgi:ribose transport system permease protein|nr:ABC transporter permease [Lachnospiraceae bacterium]
MKQKKPLSLPGFIRHNKNAIVRFGSLILVMVIFAIVTKGSIFSAYNLRSLVGQTCALLIISVGMIFMFSHGAVDISSGAVAGLCSLVITFVLEGTGSMPLAILFSVVVSVALYLFCWFVTVRFGLLSTISSLAVMFVARGLVIYILSGQSGRINISFYDLISPFKNSLPLQLIIIVVVTVVCLVLFNYTALGKYSKAIGDNPVSSQQSGANLNRVKFWCYLIAGVCVGIASVFILARAGNVSRNIGAGMEMNVMVAVILGGMNLSGGAKSRISSAIVGAITYSLLSNGLTIAGVSQGLIVLVKGIIFIVIIAMTLRQSKTITEMPR